MRWQQVEHYFQRLYTKQNNLPTNQPSVHPPTLIERIWQDDALRELTETPLMLNIITVTYATPEAPPFPEGHSDGLRAEIFGAYSERMFERVGRVKIKLLHPKEDSLHYLRYLAAQLQAHSLTQFSIGQMRGSWLPVGTGRRRYQWLNGLSFGLIFGLSFGLSFGLIVGLNGGLSAGLSVGLSGGLFVGLFFGLSAGLIVGLIVGLTFGLSAGLNYGGSFLIQHYVRLWLLNHYRLLPFQLIPFLDQAAELIFLQRVGGIPVYSPECAGVFCGAI